MLDSNPRFRLRDQSGGGGRFVFPGWWDLSSLSEVSAESVDSGFDENESVFGIDILSVSFKMLSDGDGLLDHVVKIFGELRSTTVLLQDSEDLSSGQESDLRDTVLISQGDTDLTGSQTFLGELDNQFNNSAGGESDPLGSLSSERKSAGADTFTLRVHTTHFVPGV